MTNRVWQLKHVRRVRAKGRDYFYFNTGKVVNGKKVWTRLPDVNTREFHSTYAAMLGHRHRQPAKGAMDVPELVRLFQKSKDYRDLAASSQSNYDIYLRRLISFLPTAPVAQITRADMRKLHDRMGETPGAANLFLGTCSSLFKWAVKHEYIAQSPTRGIEPMKMGEHAPWPEAVLDAALKADDDRVRLLTALMYYTALRINDVLALTWGNIQGNRIVTRPKKLVRYNQELSIPIHAALAAELARQPRAGMVVALNPATGKAYTEQRARTILQDFAARYGVKVVPHGLRKNAVNALLEAGCSVAETASISGQTLQVVEHYAKARNQQKLSDNAILRWESNA